MKAFKVPSIRTSVLMALFAALAAGWSAPAVAEDDKDAESVAKALKEGDVEISLRYRFENVSDDDPAVAAKDGNASTLRSLVTYRSASFRGFGIQLGFQDVADIGLEDDHNNAGAGSLFNGVTDRPVVADPEQTEVLTAALRYTGWKNTELILGRQLLKLGTLRVIGNVGWRQNHQAFEAFRVMQKSIPRTELSYAWVGRVHRIFGDSKPLDGHLLDAEIKVGETGRLSPYVYSLDFDAIGDAALSTITYGLRWQDTLETGGGWSFPYHLELAQQEDTGDNPAEVDAGYVRAEVSAARKAWTVGAGYELLEGSAADGRFITPLATLHAYNGWADKFLNTPTTGLEDSYLSASFAKSGVKVQVIYHDFAADTGGADYGTEVDAVLTYTTAWKQTFGVKAARYDSDGFAFDTDKLWAWTAYTF